MNDEIRWLEQQIALPKESPASTPMQSETPIVPQDPVQEEQLVRRL
jgi:hypothetical protein